MSVFEHVDVCLNLDEHRLAKTMHGLVFAANMLCLLATPVNDTRISNLDVNYKRN